MNADYLTKGLSRVIFEANRKRVQGWWRFGAVRLKEEAPKEEVPPSKGVVISILRGELMFMPWFVPWCVNERTTGFAFAIERSATNDQVQSLTKIINFSRIYDTYWKIKGPSSTLAHQAIKCVILTLLVKCAQNHSRMTHNIAIQAKLLSGPWSRQNDKFLKFIQYFKFFKESNSVPLHLLKSLCIPIQLMKGFSIPLLTLEIMTTTTGTVQHDAACCKLHSSRIQTSFDRAEAHQIIIFE